MEQSNFIEAKAFCVSHQIDYSFIQMLNENGLITTSLVEHKVYIPEDELPALEKMVRLHYDMDINVEGIETINHLLIRIEHMQHDIQHLQERLGLYE